MNEKILRDLNEGIKLLEQSPDSDFKKETLEKFKKLKTAHESQDSSETLSTTLQVVQDAYVKAAKGLDPRSRKAVEKNKILSADWAESFSNISASERPINKYLEAAARKSKEAEYVSKLKNLKKEELLELTASLIVENEIGRDWQLVLHEESEFLRNTFFTSLAYRAGKGANTAKSLSERKKENEIALERVYSIVLEEAIRKGHSTPSYLQFKRKVVELNVEPTKKKKPRLTKEEKTFPEKNRKALIDQKAQLGFAESTLRNFYEKRSGQKATTKK